MTRLSLHQNNNNHNNMNNNNHIIIINNKTNNRGFPKSLIESYLRAHPLKEVSAFRLQSPKNEQIRRERSSRGGD
jgi:hypothetical protein